MLCRMGVEIVVQKVSAEASLQEGCVFHPKAAVQKQ